MAAAESMDQAESQVDVTEDIELLLRDLRVTRQGLSAREAERRLVVYGTNELQRRGGPRWPRQLAAQFTQPLALLLWAAALLSLVAGSYPVAVAIVVIIVMNAVFAFRQEQQAERSVEALQSYLPPHARVIRDGQRQMVEVSQLVPGDLLIVEEGDRLPADARLLSGSVEVDMSPLTGEAQPVLRTADVVDASVPKLEAPELVFSGTNCTGGDAEALVYATGMHTELGRVAALSQRVEHDPSPLDQQVTQVSKLIAVIAVIIGIVFVPIGVLGGLSLSDALLLAVGVIVGNVPEGLMPVITLSLASAVSALAARGAVVKRLNAVETLGCTTVICTDKTGTLTENRMRATALWTADGEVSLGDAEPAIEESEPRRQLAAVLTRCTNAELGGDEAGDPTEIALLRLGASLGGDPALEQRQSHRRTQFHFDPTLKLMSTVDEESGALWVNAKGAPEAVLPRCSAMIDTDGAEQPLDDAERQELERRVDSYASSGERVLAMARRRLDDGDPLPERDQAEAGLCFVGLVALVDPVRAEVPDAVAKCHTAGIRVIMVTGDHGLTAAAIARSVGMGDGEQELTVLTGTQVDGLGDQQLDELLQSGNELIFARSSPETKLRIADALRAHGEVVAMTGDGVNDAPALQRADIGVAMGRSGTDVAREAATMVLTDDNFSTIVVAVEAGRRVYDNIRKFMVYIFAHATPETVPFLIFGISGGAIPLPLTVMQLLSFDVGTETLPALALGEEQAEPGLMERKPRSRDERIMTRPMLIRAWLFLGLISAALEMTGFFWVLNGAGWSPGDAVGTGSPLHHPYQQATTMTLLGMVACQVGTAFAARTDRVSLRSIGVFSNRALLRGIAFELLITAGLIYLPPLQSLLGTAALPARDLLFVLPFPFIVWGADETRRWVVRRSAAAGAVGAASSA
jgi:calcium-translocating P-type ATPase